MPVLQHSEDDRETRRLVRRVFVLGVFLLMLFSLLSWRLVNLHLYQGGRLKLAAEAERLRRIDIPAQRGPILDRRDEVLALDRRVFSVVVDRNRLRDLNLAMRSLASEQGLRPADIPRLYSEDEMRQVGVDRAVRLVAPKLGIGAGEMRAMIGSESRGEVIVARDLTDEEAQPLLELIDGARVPGIELREGMKRLYPVPDRAVHVVGFVDSEHRAIEGIEKSLDDVLAGEDGLRWMERNARGEESRSRRRPSREVRNGDGIRLTIDLSIQNIVEEALGEVGADPTEIYIPLIRPERVTIILMDPRTGGILALANRPQHALDRRKKLISNAAVNETYEPGSTFKIAAYVGALDRRLVGPATPLNLHGGRYDRGDVHIRDDHPKASLPVIGAFAQSSNIGAFKLAQQLGTQRFFHYMRSLGFGERTGIELPREAPGRLRAPSDWEVTSLPHLAFGYEVSVTPLQLLNAYAAILNDGELRRPRLVDAIISADGKVIEPRHSEVIRRVCSVAAARQLRRMLAEVVKTGTGKLAAIPGYEVAGKTGTAEKWDPKLKCYPKDRYVVSFVGFVPADRPALLGIVVVDDPKVEGKKEYGGAIAAPLFRRIAARTLEYLEVPPNPDLLAEAVTSRERSPEAR